MSEMEIYSLRVFVEERVFGGPRRRKHHSVPADDRQGYVYFVQQNDTKYIKVGRTKHPKNRLTNLQTGNPRKLKMCCKRVSDMYAAEDELLEKMDDLNNQKIRGGTEWFHVYDLERAKMVFMDVARKFPAW